DTTGGRSSSCGPRGRSPVSFYGPGGVVDDRVSMIPGGRARTCRRHSFARRPIVGACGEHPTDAAARFGNVAFIARNQMDVQMGNGLSRGQPVVYADGETGRSMSLVDRDPRFAQEPEHFPLLVFC